MLNDIIIRCLWRLIFVLLWAVTALTITTGEAGAVIVTDCAGRSVEVPKDVKRIACLYAFAGHAAVMLGRCGDIAAVSNGLKRDSLLLDICPTIEDALVPRAQGAVNLEELLKAAPDIVFVSGETGRNRAAIKKLDGMKIPWLVVDYAGIKEQQATVEMIGKAVGNPGKAARYKRYYQEVVDRVRAVTSNIPEDRRIRLYQSVNEANRTTIDKGLTTDWLKVEGVINVALNQETEVLEGKNFVSMEQILLWDPDVILVNEPSVTRRILTDRQWSTLKAVRGKRVYQMPIAISRWGHPGSIETPLAILWTAKKLYPERFRDLDMALETKAFYRNFFNYDLTEDMAERILSGKLRRKPKKIGESGTP
jgi:iron complex transport system substrate-binding protein